MSSSLVVAAVLLAGCAQVTFKPGATPTNMEADEQTCRSESADDAAFRDCMRARGWFIVQPEAAAAESGDGTEAAPPSESDAGGESPSGASGTYAPVSASGRVEASELATPAAAVEQAPPVQAASLPTEAVAPPPEAVAAPPAELDDTGPAPDAGEAAASDPLTPVNVASWWKLGGSAADLDRAIEACTDRLGEDHRPARSATVVTTGLQACLREAGWYSFGTSPR